MPAGPEPIGFAYFLAAKFAGYTAFCHWVVRPRIVLSRVKTVSAATAPTSLLDPALAHSSLGEESLAASEIPSSVKAGIIRTLIGLGVGAIVGLGFWSIPKLANFDFATPVFFALLVPVRVGE